MFYSQINSGAEIIKYKSFNPSNFEEIYQDKFTSSQVQLSGELILPDGFGKFPVVVLQHGTGDNKKKWYRDLANKNGCVEYLRVPALGTNKDFINDSKFVMKILDFYMNLSN